MKKQVSYDETMRELVVNSNDIPEDLDEDLQQETQSKIEQIAKIYKKSEGEIREEFNEQYEKRRKNDNSSTEESDKMYAEIQEKEWNEEIF